MTLHVLRHGMTLCGEPPGVPGTWPEGHQWLSEVDAQDVDYQEAMEAEGCRNCLSALKTQAEPPSQTPPRPTKTRWEHINDDDTV